MRHFDYIAPTSLAAALAVLGDQGANAQALAGGTDLLVDIKHDRATPKVLVDIGKIPDFKGIEVTGAGLRIGSAVTHTEILDSPDIAKHAPHLADAARTVGAVQTRNLGTIGGNLVTCVPSLESGPGLMVLDAMVRLAGPKGRREMTIEEFFVAPRKTALMVGELLVDILIPAKNLGKPANFLKFGLRKGQALALVNVAGSLWLKDGKISQARIALGAVAPTAIHAARAEAFLEGKAPDAEVLEEAGRIAVGDAKPIDDFRASASYRRDLIAVLTRRVLENALAMAAKA